MQGKKIFGCIFLILVSVISQASNLNVDSLKALLAKTKNDTAKIEILNLLSFKTDQPEEAIRYGRNAEELSNRIGYKKGSAEAIKNIGLGYFNQGDYINALKLYQQALVAYDSLGDKFGMNRVLSNIGNIYYNKGDDVNALDYFLKSEKLAEEIKDTISVIIMLNNIGAIYLNKKATLDKALQENMKAYALSNTFHQTDSKDVSKDVLIGTTAVNVGEVYYRKHEEFDTTESLKKRDIDSALFYMKKSLKAFVKDSSYLTYTLNFIGKVYVLNKDYDVSIQYQKEGLEISKKLDAQNDLAIALVGLGNTYRKKGDIKQALTTYKEAEKTASAIGAKKELRETYEGLAEVYSLLHDYGNAFRYQKSLTQIKDILYNIDADKKLGTLQFTYDLEKKESQITLLTKDQELKDKEISRQKLVRNSFIGGFAVVLLFAGVFFTQRNRISKEKKRSDELLLNILPEETAEELKQTGTAKAKSFDLVSVMFTDFKNFTQASERLSAEQLVKEINYCYSEFDKIITKYGLEKIKTIGDAYMCAGGLPVTNNTHPVDIIKAGLEMQEFIARNKKDRIAIDQPYFELRLGIHTGPVVAGIVGIKKFAYDIWGDTVNTASRMESSGEVGKVNISGTTYELIKDHFNCKHRGKIQAKNKGEIDMYFVEGIKV
jgi:adenylate cyclase